MKYDPQIHHRQSIRKKRRDYAGGGEYFVTICAHREAGKIFNPSAIREILKEEWLKCGEVRDDVFPGEYAIMPDHFHGLIRIVPGQSELGHVVGAFKAAVSRRIRGKGATCVSPVRRGDSQIAPAPEFRMWQRNYYERIICGAEDRERTAKYIRMNPVKLQFKIEGMPAMGNPALWTFPTLGILASGKGPLPERPCLPAETILFSGCHSGLEEQLVRESARPLIWMPAVAPQSVGFSDWQLEKLEAGCLLVVCPFSETHTTRENALKRNRIIADRCNDIWIPVTRPGGNLERLKRNISTKKKNTLNKFGEKGSDSPSVMKKLIITAIAVASMIGGGNAALFSSDFDGNTGAHKFSGNTDNVTGSSSVTITDWVTDASVISISVLTAISGLGTAGFVNQGSPSFSGPDSLKVNYNLNKGFNQGYSLTFTVDTSWDLKTLTVLAGHTNDTGTQDQAYTSDLTYSLNGGTLGAAVTQTLNQDYAVGPAYHTVDFDLTGNTIGAGGFAATWPSAPGAVYEIQTTDDLTEWIDAPIATGIPASDSGTTTSYVIPASGDALRFYRVGLLP